MRFNYDLSYQGNNLTITKALLNVIADAKTKVYGDADPSLNQGDLALNSGNYDLSYQGNNLTITKALLNVIADAKTKEEAKASTTSSLSSKHEARSNVP